MIVVAGAGGSLGPYVARRLAADGHELALIDAHPARLQGLPGAHHAVDLLDDEATRTFAASLDDVTGVLHLVGGWRGGTPLPDAPLEDWALLHDLLIRTVQHTTRAFRRPLIASGRGRFALVSAKAASPPTQGNASYAAAKAAAEAWTLAYADELAESGGSANIVVVKQISDRNVARIADAIAVLLSDTGASMNGQRLTLHR